jgi:NACalpha-BTF3-like transcription factor
MPIVNRLVCRERELAAVKVDVKDVEFIVQQLEVSKDAADRSLREHKVRLVLW